VRNTLIAYGKDLSLSGCW